MIEPVERTILNELRFSDAVTELPIRSGLSVRCREGLDVIRTRSGVFALDEPRGKKRPQTVTIEVVDGRRRYLPRRISLPVAEATVDLADAITLFPSPESLPQPGWAAVRVQVRRQDGVGARGAVVRMVRKQDGEVLARTLAEWRRSEEPQADRFWGSALLSTEKIKVLETSGDANGPVHVGIVKVEVAAFFDPSVELDAGEGGEDAWPDPDLDTTGDTLLSDAKEVDLKAGDVQRVDLEVRPSSPVDPNGDG